MAKSITQSDLIVELQGIVSKAKSKLEDWENIPEEKLQYRTSEKKWNSLECIEHLIRYAQFYDPVFQEALKKASKRTTDKKYKKGWIGSPTAYSMRPKVTGKLNKMATFKDKNPLNTALSKETLGEWSKHLAVLEEVLKKAETVDLNSVRCPLTIPVLKFYLGDTLQFIVFHIERHILQADYSLKTH